MLVSARDLWLLDVWGCCQHLSPGAGEPSASAIESNSDHTTGSASKEQNFKQI